MNKKLFIKTYGCQMNSYDSDRMEEILSPLGYVLSEDRESADAIILNTCHIREKASEKLYSEIGRIKKERESIGASKPIVVVAGCVAQAEGDNIFERSPYVDIVVGPQSYHSLPELLGRVVRLEKKITNLDFVSEAKFDLLPESVGVRGSSAYLSVQEGCDKFCTFCVVPYTRGAEFSRPVEQIYREALRYVSNGAKELYLLGQNVNAYHGSLSDGKSACSLADLIRYIAKIPELERIRYTTSHPNEMTKDLISLFQTEPKLMPFLHLPIQSGSDRILKLMNRKHNRDYYLSIVEDIKECNPNVVLSSDFIVGFPGETDEDFSDTLDLVRRVGYGQCYSFKYSPRPGTPASVMKQVPEEIKTERLAILQKELAIQQSQFNFSCIGKTLPVLFTREGKAENQLIGKTPYMQSVHVIESAKRLNLQGQIVPVLIESATLSSLSGTVMEPVQ